LDLYIENTVDLVDKGCYKVEARGRKTRTFRQNCSAVTGTVQYSTVQYGHARNMELVRVEETTKKGCYIVVARGL
jgi:hypothetical protein